MPDLLQYLLKLSVSLSVIYLFYLLVLRKLTFYTWNRWYLLGYSIFSFLIPFINISSILERNRLMDNSLVQLVPGITTYPVHGNSPVAGIDASHHGKVNWVTFIFLAGAIFMVLRLLVQYLAFLRIKKTSQLLADENVKIYQVNRNIIPFSFGNAIFINRHLHPADELQEIIRHEFVHVKQRHTVDIIWSELLCILNWYNPFAWLTRKSLRQNLEFIADDRVIENGMDKKKYQYLLLKVVGFREFSITGQFNFSSLKKRIAMMNKLKSAKVHMVKFLFALPLLGVLILACRNKINEVIQHKKEPLTLAVQKEPDAKTDIIYIAGIVHEAGTYQPINKFPLKIIINDKLVKIAETDENGFYYYSVDLKKYNGMVNYEVDLADTKYYDGQGGGSVKDSISGGYFLVTIAAPKTKKGRSVSMDVELPMKEIVGASDKQQTVYHLMQEKSKKTVGHFIDSELAREEFLKAGIKTKNYITEYKGNYFWKNGDLIGSVSALKLYINEEQVTSADVNAYVARHPFKMFGIKWNDDATAGVFHFYTYEFFKKPPPIALLSPANMNTKTPAEINKISFEKEAVFVNGFRLHPGGSYPTKADVSIQNIKNIFLFRNGLAKYYDDRLDHIWWIETVEPLKVPNRPDFNKIGTLSQSMGNDLNQTENYITEYKGKYYLKNDTLIGDASKMKLYINNTRATLAEINLFIKRHLFERIRMDLDENQLSLG